MAAPLRQIPEAELLAELDRILYDLAPSVRGQLIAAVRQIQIPAAELTAILEAGPQGVEALVARLSASARAIYQEELAAVAERYLSPQQRQILAALPEGEVAAVRSALADLARSSRSATDLSSAVRKRFLAAIKDRTLTAREVAAVRAPGPSGPALTAVSRRRVAAVQASLPWEEMEAQLLKTTFAADGPLGKAAARGADLGLKLLQGGASGGGDGVVRGPLSTATIRDTARAYVQEHGAERVKDITDSTRAGVRDVLDSAFEEALTPEQTARRIRAVLNTRQSNGFIGLDSRQGPAFQKRFAAWQADPDLSAKQIQLRGTRLHGKMLRERSDREARTELSLATNNGQKTAWREVGALNGIEIVGLEADFTAEVDGETVSLPNAPLHPRCYCMARLKRVTRADGTVVYAREWVTRVVGVCPRCKALDGVLALPTGFARA